MRVRATAKGYYGKERAVGEKFEIVDEPRGADGMPRAFSKRWMESLDTADDAPSVKNVLKDLRDKYAEVFGKKADKSLDIAQLQAEIDKKLAEGAAQ